MHSAFPDNTLEFTYSKGWCDTMPAWPHPTQKHTMCMLWGLQWTVSGWSGMHRSGTTLSMAWCDTGNKSYEGRPLWPHGCKSLHPNLSIVELKHKMYNQFVVLGLFINKLIQTIFPLHWPTLGARNTLGLSTQSWRSPCPDYTSLGNPIRLSYSF